jgi:hypothetical protein
MFTICYIVKNLLTILKQNNIKLLSIETYLFIKKKP